MSVFRVRLADLPAEVQDRLRGAARALAGPALRAGALACQALLARRTPVYTGAAKAGWQVRPLSGPEQGWGVANPAPWIGVVEEGARPHGVSREGVEAITRWFELKAGLAAAEARRAAGGYVAKLRKRGQKGTFFVKNSIPEMERLSRAEVRRHLEKYARERDPNR